MQIAVPGGTFTVEAKNFAPENRYVQGVRLNGQPYDKPYISHEAVMQGGVLEFEMGPEPALWYDLAAAEISE